MVDIAVVNETSVRWFAVPRTYPAPALAMTKRATIAATTLFLMAQIVGQGGFTPTLQNALSIQAGFGKRKRCHWFTIAYTPTTKSVELITGMQSA